MEVTYNAAKEKLNKKNHGISLQRAVDFDFASAVFEEDDREDYGEVRWLALGFLDARLHALVYTLREDKLRPISLRPATSKERKAYAEQT